MNETSAFSWNDRCRFVDIVPVDTGWLVTWGSLADAGGRLILGHRVYRERDGVRRRLYAEVLELTASPTIASAAIARFDQAQWSEHDVADLPAPL